ncbi:MAG: T9SS type A sorting domain-containing protein [Bacteroidales bacterium]|nr:T9SS type A sorting domain-containing protein [Bacteroidales bacterium]
MKKSTLKFASGKNMLLTMLFVLMAIVSNQKSMAQAYAIDLGNQSTEVQVATDNMDQLNVSFSFSGVNSFAVETKKGQFNEIAIPGLFSTGKMGTPKLPASKKLIEVPFGAEVSVQVKNFTVTEYKLSEFGITKQIMPVQPSVSKDQDASEMAFEYDEKVYQTDQFIEPQLASVEVLGVMRSYRIARLTVAPVSYNPVKGVLKIYNNVEVEVTFTEADEALTDYVKSSTWSPYFEPVHNSLLNTLGGGYPDHPDLTTYPVKYLIVADRMFEDDLQTFIEWKTMKGFKVITAYTDEIGTSYSAIQTYVHDQYNAGTPTDPAPSFILFVGDTPQIPATMGSSSGKMTDLYYGSVDGDYFPEMYYGRFSATTSGQLLTQIAKTLYYEKYEFTDPSYLNDVTLIAGADGTWNPNVAQPTILYGTENYFNASYGFSTVNAYLSSYGGCYDPERIAVSLINYTAHCSETSWGDPNLSQSAVNNFVNNGKYPIAIGNCCLAADFGYGECMGETWQRGVNKGSVAYIGSSPSSYWFEDFYWAVGAFPIQGNNNGYVPTYDETTWGAYDAPFVGDYVSTGATVFVGNLAVTEVDIQGYPQHSSPTYYWQAYNVLGDPSLVPYLTEGEENEVSHMAILPIGLDTYLVSALPGSYVAISKDGVLHGSALVDETGEIEVPIDPILSSGMVDIVVTKPQYIPYMAQVPAAALEGPYVVLEGFTINDASGNNNGLADYGENISLNVTLENVGADPSANVTATVTGTDEYVTLTSGASQSFGSIVNGEISTVENAYSFSIDNFVPNQHKAQFVLSITDGSDTWTSNLFITIQSPEIEIADSFIIDDSQTGNNDGILDPGETGLIKLSVSNTGDSDVNDVVISVTSNDPLLTINTATINVASVAAGATEDIAFEASADGAASIGYPVNVDLDAVAGPEGLYTASQTLQVVIGLIPEFNMANETVTTCVGYFYDSGGPGSEYGNSEDLTMTFLPGSGDDMIMVEFTSFDVENNYDYLYIYNGPNTSAEQFAGSPFSGTSSPGTLIALNSEGAITFKFTSDGSVTNAGWEAAVSCYNISGVPECASDPMPEDGAQNVGITSMLDWSSYDAVEFDVYFGVTNPPPFVETAGQSLYDPELIPNTTYYWKITPKNANGQAEDCPVWMFTTGGPEYLMADGTVTAANGMFYDTGGADENYDNSEDLTLTFEPPVTGQLMKFDFQQYETESSYDYLYVYDGPDTNSPEVAGSPFNGTTSPGTITSTHETGALTFHFESDLSVTKMGWVASFEALGDLACSITSNPEQMCEGMSAMLIAQVSGGSGNYDCEWSPAESLSDPNIMNPIATPSVTTTYTLTIDDGVDVMTDTYTLVVMPAPVVDLGEDVTICANHTITLDATTAGATSYLWTPGGYTTPTIEVDSTGVGMGSVIYSVLVTNANDCTGESDIEIVFDPCLGIDEMNGELNLSVYPNPASSILNINISGISESVEYTLLNYQGSKVYNERIGQLNGFSNRQLEISDYASGIYYLRLKTNDDVIIRKVVIR